MPVLLKSSDEIRISGYPLAYSISFNDFVVRQVDFSARPKPLMNDNWNSSNMLWKYIHEEIGLVVTVARSDYNGENKVTIGIHKIPEYSGEEPKVGFCMAPMRKLDSEYATTHGWLRITDTDKPVKFTQKVHELAKTISHSSFQSLHGFVLGYTLLKPLGNIDIAQYHYGQLVNKAQIWVQQYKNVPYIDLKIRTNQNIVNSDYKVLKDARIFLAKNKDKPYYLFWSNFLNKREKDLMTYEAMLLDELRWNQQLMTHAIQGNNTKQQVKATKSVPPNNKPTSTLRVEREVFAHPGTSPLPYLLKVLAKTNSCQEVDTDSYFSAEEETDYATASEFEGEN